MESRKPIIGAFDSGIGGLSIMREIRALIPEISIYYISDDAYVPYGEKSPQFIDKRCGELASELIKKEVQLIVVACNTATAFGIENLRQSFHKKGLKIPFVGVEPYLNVVNRYSFSKDDKLVVLTTVPTGNSQRFKKLKRSLDPDDQIAHFACPQLASLVEEGFKCGYDYKLNKKIFTELSPLRGKKFTHAILGCTHYSLITSQIENSLDLKCISSDVYIARRVKELLEHSSPPLQSKIISDKKVSDLGDGEFYFQSTKRGEWESLPTTFFQ